MRYFLDNCICFRYAAMLRALGVDIAALREELPENTSDPDIFRYLAKGDRIFVSEDRKQLSRICEASELKSAGISAIYFGPFWNRLGFWEQAKWLTWRWPDIDAWQRTSAKRAVVEIKQNGKSLIIDV